MKGRGQVLVALLVATAVAAGGFYLQNRVGPRPAAALTRGSAVSGAWFCPHGGGSKEWDATLMLANPGESPVSVRVTDLSAERPGSPATLSVPAGAEVQVAVPAAAREASSYVEYFGGWVAAGWVARGSEEESGVAAEPCLPEAGRSWILPDGVTSPKGEDEYLIVMNPFGADAVLSVGLLAERRAPVHPGEWTDMVLPAHRSVALRVGGDGPLPGEATVAASVDVKVGRVAASSLGVSKANGIRSTVGVPASGSEERILPAGIEAGRQQLVVANTAAKPVRVAASLQGGESEQVAPGLGDTSEAPRSAKTYDVPIEGPSTVDVQAEGVTGTQVALRSVGVSHDLAATAGAAEVADAWVVLPTAAGSPASPKLLLSDPEQRDANVTLTFLPAEGHPLVPPASRAVPDPVTVHVGAGRTDTAPGKFVEAQPSAAVLARSSSGGFVPASVSYSVGANGIGGYAISVGVPVPAWAVRS